MIKKLWLIFPAYIFLFFSCDLLRTSPYAVDAWSPGNGYHSDPAMIKISLLLSHESDKAKTEQAFSMTEDRKTLKGDFSWEGSRLIFFPASPLEVDRDYFITLGTGAQDTKGLSLENKFEAAFTTRPPGAALRIIGIQPEYKACFSGSRDEFCLYFSERITLNSCIDYVSFSPTATGSWRLEDEGRTARFFPREPWQAGSVYHVRLDSAFSGVSGAKLGTEYSSVFYGGPDREKPILLEVLARIPTDPELNCQGDFYTEEISFYRQGDLPLSAYPEWENFFNLELVFSKPVDLGGLKSLLITEPQAALLMESPPGLSDRAVFRFSEYPEWGSSFLFKLSPGVKDAAGNLSDEEYNFKVIAAGPLSKAPGLVGIRLPMAPGNLDHEALSFSTEDLFVDLPIGIGEGRYPFSVPVPSWVELYFETAPGTEIDPFSLMDLFRVEVTNHALQFSPRSISAEEFSWADPGEGWENFERLEIKGLLINTVQNGIVTFSIPAGLMDKRGNRSDRDFRISLLK